MRNIRKQPDMHSRAHQFQAGVRQTAQRSDRHQGQHDCEVDHQQREQAVPDLRVGLGLEVLLVLFPGGMRGECWVARCNVAAGATAEPSAGKVSGHCRLSERKHMRTRGLAWPNSTSVLNTATSRLRRGANGEQRELVTAQTASAASPAQPLACTHICRHACCRRCRSQQARLSPHTGGHCEVWIADQRSIDVPAAQVADEDDRGQRVELCREGGIAH